VQCFNWAVLVVRQGEVEAILEGVLCRREGSRG
jgi:hypothetical protein